MTEQSSKKVSKDNLRKRLYIVKWKIKNLLELWCFKNVNFAEGKVIQRVKRKISLVSYKTLHLLKCVTVNKFFDEQEYISWLRCKACASFFRLENTVLIEIFSKSFAFKENTKNFTLQFNVLFVLFSLLLKHCTRRWKYILYSEILLNFYFSYFHTVH